MPHLVKRQDSSIKKALFACILVVLLISFDTLLILGWNAIMMLFNLPPTISSNYLNDIFGSMVGGLLLYIVLELLRITIAY